MSIKRVCDFCGKLDDGEHFMLEKGDLHMCASCITLAHHACLEYNENRRREAERRTRGDADSA